MARTPVALVAGTPQDGMLMTSGDSVLYSMTGTGVAIAHLAISATDANAQPGGAIFPDGTWTGAAGLHYVMQSGGTIDAIVADLGTEAPYSFTVSGGAETLTSAAEGNDATNGTIAGAGVLDATAIPFEQTGGTLSSAADIDIIKFTVAAGDANRSIELITDAGADPNTDTAVDIVDAAGTSFLQAYGGGPVDGSECEFGPGECFPGDILGEDVVSDQLPAGTYYVKVSAGSLYATTDKAYTAIFWLQ
jgi:hypothetical protein